MYRILASTLVVLPLLLGACSLESGVLLPMDGAGPDDPGGGEAGMSDSGPQVPDSSRGDAAVMDSSSDDAGRADSGAGDGGSLDSGPADTGVADTGPADTGAPDTGPPDTGRPDTGAPPPSCDSLFGSIRSYSRCRAAETDTACEFYSDPSSNMTCTQLCAVAGQSCIDTWHEGTGADICAHAGSRGGCSDSGDAYLCRCTRPTS